MNNTPVLYYHSIAPKKDRSWYKSYLTYELVYFEDLLKYLVSKKYTFLTLDEYFEQKKHKSSSKNICLTFDDGCLDNFIYVYPLLKKFNAKATIFISSEFIQDKPKPRKTLEDVWSGNTSLSDIKSLGFISWNEAKLMEESGVVDIQSHTMTHTKYFSSDKIREFHHPKSNYLYPIGNLYPDKKPYYITDDSFINLLPYGTPFFEEKSALITQKIHINNSFLLECTDILKINDWDKYDFYSYFNQIEKLYQSYVNKNSLITEIESIAEYQKRVREELSQSKEIIEKKLGKTVNHVCWPHGDYNDYCHQIAKEVGYKSSNIVLNVGEKNTSSDRFDRFGSNAFKNNRFLTLLKAKYKINSYRDIFPYNLTNTIYNRIKYGSK